MNYGQIQLILMCRMKKVITGMRYTTDQPIDSFKKII